MTDALAADLCVVIPALNEAEALPHLLRDLAAQKGLRVDAVVADGGSSDATVAIARAAGARIVQAGRGRGRQMNAGARTAGAEYLLFLHADSRLEQPQLLTNALKVLRAAGNASRVAGHFALAFAREQPGNGLAWRYLEAKSALNRPGTTNGDQGLLLSKRYFDELHGFDESLPWLEDQRICARIRAGGQLITLPGRLQTSARRFERVGFHRQCVLMTLIMTMHALDLRAFFEQAAGIYQAQHEPGNLRVLPFFRLAMHLLRTEGWLGYLKHWRGIGRYGCDNAWQLFFFFDVVMRRQGTHPLLRFHDRRIARPWRRPGTEVCAAILLWLHLHIVILPWIWWQDLRRR